MEYRFKFIFSLLLRLQHIVYIENDAEHSTLLMTLTHHGTSYSPCVYSVDVFGIEVTDRPNRLYVIPLWPIKMNQARVTLYKGN